MEYKLYNNEELIKNNLIVSHYAGSRAYGTSTPESDIDIRGIFFSNPINTLSPFFKVNEIIENKETDIVFYEYQHFIDLLVGCNPNILESVYISEEDIIFKTPEYDILRGNRNMFLSSKIAHTTTGYAHAQFFKIKENEYRNKDPKMCKHAMHLVRLMKMGQEALRDGQINIKRPDAEELLEIRKGKISYEDLSIYVKDMDREIREVLYNKTYLPHHPDKYKIAQLIIDLRQNFWKRNNLI
jgi:predicted nucleotidyltransferase